MEHRNISPHLPLMPQMTTCRVWVQLVLETGIPANQCSLEFLMSLRRVGQLLCGVIDRILGNHAWMAPSVGNGFIVAEQQLPLALSAARNGLAARNHTKQIQYFNNILTTVFQLCTRASLAHFITLIKID